MKRFGISVLATGLVLALGGAAVADEIDLVTARFSKVAPGDGIRTGPVSKGEAQAWLTELEVAWERKDVAGMSQLGAVRSGFEEQLAQALKVYQQLDVAFDKQNISLRDGEAVVSFDRIDTDESTKPRRHPQRYTFELQRTSTGEVVAKPRPSSMN